MHFGQISSIAQPRRDPVNTNGGLTPFAKQIHQRRRLLYALGAVDSAQFKLWKWYRTLQYRCAIISATQIQEARYKLKYFHGNVSLTVSHIIQIVRKGLGARRRYRKIHWKNNQSQVYLKRLSRMKNKLWYHTKIKSTYWFDDEIGMRKSWMLLNTTSPRGIAFHYFVIPLCIWQLWQYKEVFYPDELSPSWGSVLWFIGMSK